LEKSEEEKKNLFVDNKVSMKNVTNNNIWKRCIVDERGT